MMEKRMNDAQAVAVDDGRRSLKNALIVFAVIEALVLVPLALYMIFR
jgi:hypothetical protein